MAGKPKHTTEGERGLSGGVDGGPDIKLPPPMPLSAEQLEDARELTHIHEAIQESREVLDYENDWDDEGSPGYSEYVWNRAKDFLTRNSLWLLQHCSFVVPKPKILPGPEGSIDVHWEEPDYEFLVNFPADPAAMASFYGDDRGEISIKGKFDPASFNHGLLLWLTKAS